MKINLLHFSVVEDYIAVGIVLTAAAANNILLAVGLVWGQAHLNLIISMILIISVLCLTMSAISTMSAILIRYWSRQLCCYLSRRMDMN